MEAYLFNLEELPLLAAVYGKIYESDLFFFLGDPLFRSISFISGEAILGYGSSACKGLGSSDG